MKILAVDDHPLVLQLLEATLGSLGYDEADFATSASDALTCLDAAQTPYSCILLDIQMPGIDGIELCRMIREIPHYEDTPIIMLTAMAEKAYVDESFASGATDYLNKPIDAIELGARLHVAQIINDQRARSSTSPSSSGVPSDQDAQGGDFGFEDPVQIKDVPRVLNTLSFENYLNQLDRLDLFKVGIIGFQIRDAAALFSQTTRREYMGILTDVAQSIFENVRSVNPLISYIGSGTFVAVVPRPRSFDRADLEAGIAMTLFSIQLADMFGMEYDIRVDVGQQFNGGIFRKTKPGEMIASAIKSARRRGAPMPARSSLTGWFKIAG